ncbi:U exon, partial [Human mastadenovirus C]
LKSVSKFLSSLFSSTSLPSSQLWYCSFLLAANFLHNLNGMSVSSCSCPSAPTIF